MSTHLVFWLFFPLLIAFTAWRLRSAEDALATASVLSAWGIYLTAGAITLLPWVHIQEPTYLDAQCQQLYQFANLSLLREHLPCVPQTATADTAAAWQPTTTELFTTLRGHKYLTGLQLLQQPAGATPFRWMLILSLASALLALLALLLYNPISINRSVRLGTYAVIATLSALSLLTALWHLPSVDTFGIRGDFDKQLLFFLAGTHVGIGAWVVLVGLTMLVVSALLLGADIRGTSTYQDLE